MNEFDIIDAINVINSNNQNRNLIPCDIYEANPDGTYNVRVTIDMNQDGNPENIDIHNRKPDSDISYYVRDTLETAENTLIPAILNCPNGDINRSTIAGLAQYNLPPTPTVDHFETLSCFFAGTLIKTFSGEIPIEKIKSGMKVCGWNEALQKVVNCKVKSLLIHDKEKELVSEYFLVNTKSSEVKSTGNHSFFIGKGKYEQLKDIYDSLYVLKNNIIKEEKIIRKELIRCEKAVTYNLSLAKTSPQNYFANNFLVHNMGGGKY